MSPLVLILIGFIAVSAFVIWIYPNGKDRGVWLLAIFLAVVSIPLAFSYANKQREALLQIQLQEQAERDRVEQERREVEAAERRRLQEQRQAEEAERRLEADRQRRALAEEERRQDELRRQQAEEERVRRAYEESQRRAAARQREWEALQRRQNQRQAREEPDITVPLNDNFSLELNLGELFGNRNIEIQPGQSPADHPHADVRRYYRNECRGNHYQFGGGLWACK
ncbi:MAG: hypothetical protein AAFX98_05920 [Pseudomonadota bacterium]